MNEELLWLSARSYIRNQSEAIAVAEHWAKATGEDRERELRKLQRFFLYRIKHKWFRSIPWTLYKLFPITIPLSGEIE